MKTAIFTLAIGQENPMYKAALLSFENYAKKVGADLVVAEELHYPITIENPRHTSSPAWTEKLYIKELLKSYDRVLYVDADIIIHPNAENIFEKYADLETSYLFNEGYYADRQPVIEKIENVLGKIENWPVVNNLPLYYNSGCMLTSRDAGLFDKTNIEDMQKICNEIKYYDQTYINYILHQFQLKHESLSSDFNRMDMLGREGFDSANFIHYAGRGYSSSTLKRELKCVDDFCTLYQGVLPQQQLDELLEKAWDLFINKAKKRYKLPRFILSFIARTFVKP